MSLLFAAIGATVTALVEATLAPYIEIADVAPHPVLVGGVVWTIAAGIDRGITWAFVGGLVLDSLLGRPLGVSAFALLASVGGAALIAQPFPRLRLVAPVVAVPILSLVNSLLIMTLTTAARPGADFPDPFSLFLPGAIYDGVIGMFVGPLAVLFHDRRAATTERLEW
jgi:rod shape-determining protein MreD